MKRRAFSDAYQDVETCFMRVSDIVAAGGLVIQPPWATFEQAVEGLVASLVENAQLRPTLAEAAIRAVCERERLASTAIVEIGVSIPHARIEGVDGLVAAIAGSPTAVYYHMQRVPITLMALVLSAPNRAGEHLNFLSKLSMLLQSESLRFALCHAANRAAALAVLRGQPGA
jgi:mannitol/fructose-specific phosphotransferase system IIA component (Ntr-type)